MAKADYALLQPSLERVALDRGQDLMLANEPVAHVYFLEGGVASNVADIGDDAAEVGLIGREGMVGGLVLMGTDRGPERSFMQIDHATALRIGTSDLRAAAARSESLRLTLMRYLRSLMIQSARTAASNALHALPQRLARWLVMCHDRIDGDQIALTHKFLAMMLGVRRAGVTVSLHILEGEGGIASRRGEILIRDRTRLLATAGAAYGAAEEEYRRLLGPFGKPLSV